MSKTYWLVSSNGVPKTTKKNNQLFLGDVNAGSVKELKRSEKYNYVYYLKDTDESILDKNITSQISIKTKWEAMKMIPKDLIYVSAFLFIYFALYMFFTIREVENASIYIAFAAMVSTFLISFIKIFKKDAILGPISTIAIGAGVAYIITNNYLLINNKMNLPSFLNKTNIGNLLTVICSIITLIGYVNDAYLTFQREKHISTIEENSK